MEREKEGRYRFTGGKGNTVIDYMLGEREIRKKIEKMKIGNRVSSDHHPVELWEKWKKRKEKKGTRGAEEFGMERERKSLGRN